MLTTSYNPSDLETEMASIIKSLKNEIEAKLSGNVIQDIIVAADKDNPDVLLKLVDIDGDKHEMVIKIIQRPDQNL